MSLRNASLGSAPRYDSSRDVGAGHTTRDSPPPHTPTRCHRQTSPPPERQLASRGLVTAHELVTIKRWLGMKELPRKWIPGEGTA